ncbi:hypothetical protein [Mycobacterium sp. IDR2000157661]|uniref:hypothetical protein n=1 Tax=Mycobacterium sp. IDR2000157661 TaxID=2867005 RepID=UPI001EECBEE3|nr:hypothetical protein [Mycobacterium sp. IDR2000157661]ULE34190.1 hypothetical protein K3G64_05935 [Mycobacterium sp. IDR2000157661]
MTAPPPRPRVVEVAFWIILTSAVLLIIGGLMASAADFDDARSAVASSVTDEDLRQYLTLYRGAGLISVLVGGALAFVAGRARRGDARFYRATVGLALAAVLVVGVFAVVLGVAQLVTLAALLPLLIGVLVIVQPAARSWFAVKPEEVP